MYPVLLQLGPVTIYSFGAMMAVALLTGGWLVAKEMDRKGLPGELASNLLVAAAIGAVVGGRLWVVIEDWRGFLNDPIGMIFTGSGFAFYGGFVAAVLLVYLTVRRHGLPWWSITDCAAPVIALGHAIGRVGCQLAGDGDWGTVSELPWAMAYPNAIIGWDHPPGVRVHPTPLYEMLAYLAVFAVLWRIRTRPRADGQLFCWYLVLAPSARFLIEFVRHNPRHVFGLSVAQLFSILLIALGVAGFSWLRGARAQPAAVVRTPRR
jgi:phosphatidylglycerol:prolipoprotein diacylglycerol transferase